MRAGVVKAERIAVRSSLLLLSGLMRKPMLYIVAVAVFAVLLLGLLVVASRRPDSFRVERSIVVAAPASRVFAQVDDFHRWQAWSPYVEFDPNMRTTYTGPDAGPGASMAWKGNGKAGSGSMTIVEERPGELVRIQLQFTKPFAATNTAEFTFQPDGGGTRVTWAMTGRNNFMFKIMQIFMNMDRMVGRDFERGLAKMKAVVESGGQA